MVKLLRSFRLAKGSLWWILTAPRRSALRQHELTCIVLREEHVDQLIALYGIPATQGHRERQLALMNNPRCYCIGAFWRARLVATLWVTPMWEHLGIPGDWVGAAHVKPEMRRRGIGKRLLSACLAEAATRKIETLYGNIRADNTASLALARSIGGQEIVETDWTARLTRHHNSEQVIVAVRVRTGNMTDNLPV